MSTTRKTPKLRFPEFTDDWEQRKLKEIACKVKNKNKENAISETFTNSAEFGIISQKEFFDHEVASKTNLDSYYIVDIDDFVYNPRISVTAPVGPINRNKLGKAGVMSPLYTVFKTQGVSIDFLEHYFKSTNWHSYMYLNGDSGARSDRFSIKDDVFFDMPIMVPCIKEQMQIGLLFNAISKNITLHQRELDSLKKLKKSLLQKMFPKNGEKIPELRFPEFTGDWEQRKLKEITSRVQGNDGRVNLQTLTISAGNGWMKQEDRFSANIAGKEQKNYTLLKKGELAYNHGNSKLAKFGAVFELKDFDEALVPRVYHSFRVNNKTNSSFIEYMFATKLPDKELGKLVSSGARMDGLLNIGYEDFVGINITVPSLEEQQKIAYHFRKLDEVITLHQRELDTLKKLKKGLLQNMFV